MQVQKDVLIAGGVVVVCVALVVVALVATGSRTEAPTTDVATGSSSTSGYTPSTSAYGDPTGSGSASTTPGSGFDGSDPYGGFAPAPSPGGSPFAGEPAVTSPSGSGQPDPWTTTTAPAPAPAAVVTQAPITVEPAATGGGTTHTVAKGETLGDISTTHYGTARHWRKIVDANPGLDPTRLMIGQVIQIPAVAASAAAPTAAAIPDGEAYTVQKGDSYYTIARKLLGSGSRWRELERLNTIPAESLRVGTVIRVPPRETAGAPVGAAVSATGRSHVVAKGETLGDISKQYFGTTTKWKQIAEANPGVRPENLKVGQSLAIPDLPSAPTASTTTPGTGGNTYTVKSGDTLESIAAAQLGQRSAWKQIVEANPGLKPTALRVGQVIVLPGGAAGTPSAPTPAPGFTPAPTPTPTPAPAPDQGFQSDPFYSPYDSAPAAPAPSRPFGGLDGPGASGV